MLDAFWALRKKNALSKGRTALCLALILPVSGAYPLAKLTKAFLFEVYRVPGRSMSPTIREGDRILSTRCGTWFRPVERFDVVVFRFPLNETRAFVKRVVGLPGEELVIRDGEIFARPKGEGRFRIARKPPRAQELLWIDPAEGADFLKDADAFRKCWGPWGPYTVGAGRLSIPGEATFRFLPEIEDGGGAVGDARLAVGFRMTGSRGEVRAEIANSRGRFAARLAGEAEGALAYSPRDSSKGEASMPLSARMVRGRDHAFELAVSDGRARVRLDGALLADLRFMEFLEEGRGLPEIPTSVSFGVKGDGLTVERLAVGRDLHYRGRPSLPDGEAVAVPDGAYFMLGDDALHSHDSRGWTRWTYRLKGRPDPVECEGQETTDGGHPPQPFLAELQRRHRLAAEPDAGIRSDRSGKERYLFKPDLEGEPREEPFRFIPRRYLTGRVVKIWWPPGRAGPVR